MGYQSRAQARVARQSRIYVEGRHDAELVERIWGDDLRHVGVVVEHLGVLPVPQPRVVAVVLGAAAGRKKSAAEGAARETWEEAGARVWTDDYASILSALR